MTSRGYMQALPFIRMFNVLTYAGPVTDAAASSNLDCLARYRQRFRGALDLHRV